MDFNFQEGLLFFANFDTGMMSKYEFTLPLKVSSKSTLSASFKGKKACKALKYYSKRKEVYTGHSNGYMSVYSGDRFELSTLIFYEQLNISDITAIKIYEDDNLIGVSSKDRTVKLWRPAFEQLEEEKIGKKNFEGNNHEKTGGLEEIMEDTGFDSLNTYKPESFNY